ncbi:hypothetical protein [Deinococcus alpinitundrae]|uniref:hypothetical protein n=1 Tax=Deinococcus alpinitundrae TaxID=468913 RepID=UPI001ED9492B|nr:hypothetical protein [Deinococcus alpinitundrae]
MRHLREQRLGVFGHLGVTQHAVMIGPHAADTGKVAPPTAQRLTQQAPHRTDHHADQQAIEQQWQETAP